MDDARKAALDAVTIGGARRHDAPIVHMPYDESWPVLFEREATRVRAALGERVLLIEHAGSTSVPGLSAKPVIDMVLAVPDSTDEAAYVPSLERAGYVLRLREPDWFQHRLFKGPDTNVNLHTFTQGSPEVRRMLAFRDRLRTHPEELALYEDTKRDLAGRTWTYVQDYADAKGAVVEEIIGRALDGAGHQRPHDPRALPAEQSRHGS
jgi:GrpB-like predicted nucleotidyltransferase (UPF0157 family)